MNDINLAEIQGGEVAITNLLSCNGPDFIMQLRFMIKSENPGMLAAILLFYLSDGCYI